MVGSILSLTLLPSGNDRSTIKRHFPVDPFGITPNQFIINAIPSSSFLNGPNNLPGAHSSYKYSDTTSALSVSDLIFALAEQHLPLPWKPILNPSLRPVTIYSQNHWSGWYCKALLHILHCSEVVIVVVSSLFSKHILPSESGHPYRSIHLRDISW